MFNSIVMEFGVIMILVNNVGIICDNLVMCMGDDEWDVVIDINLKVVFCMLCGVMCGMMKVWFGCIINVILVVGYVGNVG